MKRCDRHRQRRCHRRNVVVDAFVVVEIAVVVGVVVVGIFVVALIVVLGIVVVAVVRVPQIDADGGGAVGRKQLKGKGNCCLFCCLRHWFRPRPFFLL